MLWLQLSDIHYNPQGDNSMSLHMRERLLEFLSSEIIDKYGKIDKLFITGDLRFAPAQDDEETNAQIISDFIMDVARAINISSTEDIIIVPGNHDLNRKYFGRRHIITGVKKEYISSGQGSFDEVLPLLTDGFGFLFSVYSKLYGDQKSKEIKNGLIINPHRILILDKYSILLLNTSILCGENKEEGSIIVGQKYVVEALQDIKRINKKPVIALGHHGMRMLEPSERVQIQNIFRDYGVVVYLCGHEHEIWNEKIDNMWQINMGCIKVGDSAQVGFSVGEYDSEEDIAHIEAYLWDSKFGKWSQYTHFGNKNGILNLHLNQFESSDICYYNTLSAMFNDIEQYLSARAGVLNNNVIVGFGMDLQVALPWLEKISSLYIPNVTFKSLVFSLNNQYISTQRDSESSFDTLTLRHSIDRFKLIGKKLGKFNRVEIKFSHLPYPFHGVLIDDCLFGAFMSIDRSNMVHASSKFMRIVRNESPLANNIVDAFNSWFDFYWEHGDLVFTTD